MTSETPFTLRWGILATGGIAKTFTRDLLIDPQTRNVTSIRHDVVAAASSSSSDRVASFLKDVGAPNTAKAYGSYEALVADPDVDIIYVATPHSHHYAHIKLALNAGKHVLAEKPITVNLEQCRIVCELAKEKGRFLMEALWTRFFPLVQEVQEILKSKKPGEIKRVFADFAFSHDLDTAFDPSHRIVNPDLAGGALLDLGIYSLTWIFMALYQGKDPRVASVVSKYKTGVDQQSTMILDFGGAHGIATTSLIVASTPNSSHNTQHDVRIQGTLGDLTVNVADKPNTYRLTPASGAKAAFEYEEKTFQQPGGGKGMFWEADECARCIRDGKLESEGMGWKESEAVVRVMDAVRKEGGVVYGDIEDV